MEDASKIVITDQDLHGESPHPIENIRENLGQSARAAKVAALRHEIQLGIDDIEAGRVIKLDMDRLDEYFAKF